MAHFVEQYSDYIKNCEDYNMLGDAINICIEKNIINFVSSDIKEAIDKLNVDTPFNRFVKTMVWASTVSDHTETSLNLLRYFCNKVVSQYDSLSIQLDEFSLMVIAICADDKSFLLKLTDDELNSLINMLSYNFCNFGKLDSDSIVLNAMRESVRYILEGKTMQDLDTIFKSLYSQLKDYQINEQIRPMQSLLINLIQNMDQHRLLNLLSIDEWQNRLDQQITNAAAMFTKNSNEYEKSSYRMAFRDLIHLFKDLNDKLSKTGYTNIENYVVGEYINSFLIILNRMYDDNISLDNIVKIIKSAASIFYNNFAVTDIAKNVINLTTTSYCDSGKYEDAFFESNEYFNALKSYLNKNDLFLAWKDSTVDSEIISIPDRVYATYLHQYTRPILSKADELIKNSSDDISNEPEVVNEAALEYIKAVGNILNKYYDNYEDDMAIEAAGYSDENKYPVFILLTLGHTPLSKIITTATGDQWSHSSLAFNIKLEPLYSFGTKKMNGSTPELGFVQTTPYSNLWGKVPVRYELYATFVNHEALAKMKNRLKFFLDNHDKLKYDFVGLAKNFFHIKNKNEAKWFCSRFVAEIINSGKSVGKDPSLFRPQTLKEIKDVEKVISGPSVKDYDYKAAERALEKLKLQPQRNLQPANEAKSEQWTMDDEDDTKEYNGPKIEATQSNKGYKKGSKVQADSERKIYSAYKKYKNNEEKVDSQLSKMLTAAKKAFTPDKTEEIIEGKKFSPISLLKKVLITSAIFNFSKVGAFAYLVASWTLDKRRTKRQKTEILLQINTEIKMLDEKIDDARGDGNREAKYALMRTREELIRARDKIKYNLTATKEDMKTAKTYINNDDRDNI